MSNGRTQVKFLRASLHALVGTALLCLLLGALAAPAGAAPWLTAPNLSPTGLAFEPQVAVDASGDAVAVWSRYGPQGSLESASKPAGGPWEEPVRLSSLGQVENPQVAIDPAGNAVAVWQSISGSEILVHAASRSAEGAWAAAEVLSEASDAAGLAQVALDSAGDAVVVWQRFDGSVYVVQAASRPAGGSWQAPVNLSEAGQDAQMPQVAVDSAGDAVAVWQRFDGSTYLIQTASKAMGGIWGAPENLTGGGQKALSPQVAVDSAGDAVAAWELFQSSESSIQTSSRAAGGAWGSSETLSAPGSESHSPVVALDNAGDAVAVWRGTASVPQVSSRLAGGSWQTPIVLSTAGQTYSYPQVAIDPTGDAVAVWNAWDGSDFSIQVASKSAGGAWQSPSVELKKSSAYLYQPDVAIAPTGNAVAIWASEEAPSSFIQSANQGVFLTVTKAGAGSGTVTSTPTGIDCGSTCEGEFREGTVVTLSPAAADGSRFSGWSGDCSGSGPCRVTMSELRSVSAEFTPVSPVTPSELRTCSLVSASAASFVPNAKLGDVVAGVRAKVSVTTPSQLQVLPTVTYKGKDGKVKSVALGSRSFHAAAARNLRMALPSSLRSRLPLGTKVSLSLEILATPDSSPHCTPAKVSTKKLRVTVVKVLSSPQPGVS